MIHRPSVLVEIVAEVTTKDDNCRSIAYYKKCCPWCECTENHSFQDSSLCFADIFLSITPCTRFFNLMTRSFDLVNYFHIKYDEDDKCLLRMLRTGELHFSLTGNVKINSYIHWADENPYECCTNAFIRSLNNWALRHRKHIRSQSMYLRTNHFHMCENVLHRKCSACNSIVELRNSRITAIKCREWHFIEARQFS